MDKWFTVDRIDEDTYIISEYRHWGGCRAGSLCLWKRSGAW